MLLMLYGKSGIGAHVCMECNKHFICLRHLFRSTIVDENLFLEGTGSMILDRVSKIAYACRSERTAEALFMDFCSKFE